MPEIWLPYGSVEVAVDVKAENLAEVLESFKQALTGEQIAERLGIVEAKGRVLIVAVNAGSAALKTLSLCLSRILEGSVEAHIYTERRSLTEVKAACEGRAVRLSVIPEPTEEVDIVEGFHLKVPRLFKDFDSKLVISEVGFDPLFGFDGGPVALLKSMKSDFLKESFRKRSLSYPKPGLATEAGAFAVEAARRLEGFTSIECVSCRGEVAEIFTGSLEETHVHASKRLVEAGSKILEEPAAAVMVSPGGLRRDFTLSSSVRCLWNVMPGVKETGVIVLVAECSEGLGSESFSIFSLGRLRIEDALRREEYFDGFEDLIYLREASQHYKLVVVSTLPHYYVETMLGLKAAGKAGDALNYILSRLGSKVKVHILPYGSETLLRLEE